MVVDWEHFGWAPPAADEAFFAITCRAIGLRTGWEAELDVEVLRFWQAEIARRFSPDNRDQRLAVKMLRYIDALIGRSKQP
jgi:hypothetical protein